MLTAVLLYLFPLLMICAALWDLLTFEIPNWLTLAVFFAFLALSLALPLDLYETFSRIGLGMVVLLAGVVLFARGLLGGGDVKLLAASAVWIGWAGMPLYLVEVAVFGGILALAVLAFRRVPIPPTWTSRDWLRRLHGRAQGVPYGIAIGAAGLLAFQHLALH